MIPQEEKTRFPFSLRLNSSQLRSALTYILLISAVLLLLNLYSAVKMRHLAFSAQEATMTAQAKLVSGTLGNMELTTHGISRQLATMQEVQVSQILVVDHNDMVLYENTADEATLELLQEHSAKALENYDVIHCQLTDHVMECYAAMPIYSGTELVGAICLLHEDQEQGTMIVTLQENLLVISVVTEILFALLALFFAVTYSRRMRRILRSVRTVRQGDYSYRIATHGSDEVSKLAEEFNDLTSRLQESENRRRQFVSDASHELKTPLASIKLMTDTILQNPMDADTTREFVQDIGDEADRLTRLSQKLLELTKIDSHPESEREIVRVDEVMQKVVRMVQPLVQQRGLTLETELAEDCMVMTQEDDLYQILFNLTENAIKYNRPNGWLKISAATAGDSVVLMVQDSGIGIPDEAMSHIFERFYRADKARSRAAGGAGLGLSIVHDMVERNDGSISVSHRQGGGTTFTVTFPLFEYETAEEAPLDSDEI